MSCACSYSCMPQGKRTAVQESAFGLMLSNVNLVFLGCSVLILLDLSYCSRFWYALNAMNSDLH